VIAMKKASKVMTRDLRTIEPEATVQAAARLMKKHDVGMLPVITPEGRAVGTITDRDITVRGVAEGVKPEHGKVLDAMTPGVEFCYTDDDLDRLAQHMGEKKLHRILVIDRETKGIKGIISLGDIAAKSDKKMAGDVLARCVG
jgi:CBS domain-containing protein